MGQALQKLLIVSAEVLLGESCELRNQRLDIEEYVFGSINLSLGFGELLLFE